MIKSMEEYYKYYGLQAGLIECDEETQKILLRGKLVFKTLRDISIDSDAQRPLKTKRCHEIAKEFDPFGFGCGSLAEYPDGKLETLADGQTRNGGLYCKYSNALDIKLPWMVYPVKDKKEAGRLFDFLNAERVETTAQDDALVVARTQPESREARIESLLRDVGYWWSQDQERIPPIYQAAHVLKPKLFHPIMKAVCGPNKKLYDVTDDEFAQGLRILRIIFSTYRGAKGLCYTTPNKDVIAAMALFLHTHWGQLSSLDDKSIIQFFRDSCTRAVTDEECDEQNTVETETVWTKTWYNECLAAVSKSGQKISMAHFPKYYSGAWTTLWNTGNGKNKGPLFGKLLQLPAIKVRRGRPPSKKQQLVDEATTG